MIMLDNIDEPEMEVICLIKVWETKIIGDPGEGGGIRYFEMDVEGTFK